MSAFSRLLQKKNGFGWSRIYTVYGQKWTLQEAHIIWQSLSVFAYYVEHFLQLILGIPLKFTKTCGTLSYINGSASLTQLLMMF